jgi:formylglycine-generating enzyme required for sulfatase activity
MRFVLIPPGEFEMGSPEGDLGLSGVERPQHTVHTVRITKPFYLGVTEVTQVQYGRVMDGNPSCFKGDPQRPVEMVSWDDAKVFCRKLSEKEDGTYRLPTEAEWEYACRAGTTTKWCFGDDESSLPDYAWYLDNANRQTHTVGQKKSNGWGLYDMHGNVWEWCADWFDGQYYPRSPSDDPAGPDRGLRRVYRGGSSSNDASNCRASCRYWLDPGIRNVNLGFRLARTVSFPSTSR